jgi:hypothetical protein
MKFGGKKMSRDRFPAPGTDGFWLWMAITFSVLFLVSRCSGNIHP